MITLQYTLLILLQFFMLTEMTGQLIDIYYPYDKVDPQKIDGYGGEYEMEVRTIIGIVSAESQGADAGRDDYDTQTFRLQAWKAYGSVKRENSNFGMTMEIFLVNSFRWDRTPKGIPKAGWGLHLRMKDLAKLGYLLLKKGKWEERQLVHEPWVATMSSKHVGANSKYDYGYQCWIPKDIGTSCFLFRGSYPPSTKIVAVLPELNSVVVYVGENYETNTLLRDFIVPALK